MPLIDCGETACKPDAQGLQHIGLKCEEGGDRADHRTEHDAHNRHNEAGFEAHPSQEEKEHRGANKCKKHCTSHTAQYGRRRKEIHHKHQPHTGPFCGASGGGFHKFIAGEQLHNQSAHCHSSTGQNESDGAGHSGDAEHPPTILGAENVILAYREGDGQKGHHKGGP